MKSGSLSITSCTCPQAHQPVCFIRGMVSGPNKSLYLDSLLRTAYTCLALALEAFVSVVNTNAIHSIKEDCNNE